MAAQRPLGNEPKSAQLGRLSDRLAQVNEQMESLIARLESNQRDAQPVARAELEDLKNDLNEILGETSTVVGAISTRRVGDAD